MVHNAEELKNASVKFVVEHSEDFVDQKFCKVKFTNFVQTVLIDLIILLIVEREMNRRCKYAMKLIEHDTGYRNIVLG